MLSPEELLYGRMNNNSCNSEAIQDRDCPWLVPVSCLNPATAMEANSDSPVGIAFLRDPAKNGRLHHESQPRGALGPLKNLV
jgi:hypothetical protein